MKRLLLITAAMGMYACSAHKFLPIEEASLQDDNHVRLVLSVSDTVFSLPAIRAHVKDWNPFDVNWPKAGDSVGPIIYVWLKNDGPERRFPIGYYPLDMGAPVWLSGGNQPFKIVLSRDGQEFDYPPARLPTLGHSDIPPCRNYSRMLRHVHTGETVPIAGPLVFALCLDQEELKPGDYEVGLVMWSACAEQNGTNDWSGIARSNRVRFRLIE